MEKHNQTNIIKKGRGRPKKNPSAEIPIIGIKEKTKAIVFAHLFRKDAPPEHYFVLNNGQKIKNVLELADLLGTLDDGVFYYHVTAERNDFAAWIDNIFKDTALANEIRQAKDKLHLQFTIYKHIAHKLW